MGFLKKKPSVKLSNHGEISSNLSSKSSPAMSTAGRSYNATSPRATSQIRAYSPRTAFIEEERRDDGSRSSGSRRGADTEKRVTGGGAGEAGGTTAVPRKSSTKEERAKTSSRQSKKEPGSSSSISNKQRTAKKEGGSSSSSQKQRKSRGDRPSAAAAATSSSRTKAAAAAVSRPTNKAPSGRAREKKQQRNRSRSRSASAGPRRRGGPSHARGTTKNRERSKSRDRRGVKSSAAYKPGKRSETTPKITNTKASVIKNRRHRVASPVRRPRSIRRPFRRNEVLSESEYESSVGSSESSSDDDSYGSSSYYSETETEIEDSTMYTETESYEGIGYNTTHEDGLSHSASAESDVFSDMGMEVTEADTKSITDDLLDHTSTLLGSKGSVKSPSTTLASSPRRLDKATKESLANLGDLVEKAKLEKKENDATFAAAVTDTGAFLNGAGVDNTPGPSPLTVPYCEEQSPASQKSPSSKKSNRSAKSAAAALLSNSAFIKKMEGFVAKNPEHQLSVQVRVHGNVEKLELQELGCVPKPNKPSEVVIKIDCSTITLQDCMIRRGKWYEMQNLPFVPGSDFIGTIHEMGKEASKNSTFRVGDKVAAAVPSGGNAKYITLPYNSIIRVPPETDSVLALCLSSMYVPAREALDLARKMNTPFTGANILIIGGNGPSGLASIELALLEGANVFTTADERHHQYLSNLGAKCFPIDPNKWLPTLQGKMDVVLDSVCLDAFESSNLALNSAGTLVCTGMSAVYTQGQIRAYGMRDVRDYKAKYCQMRAKYILSNTVYYDRTERFENAPNEYAQHLRYLCHLASKDTIKPLVSSCTPLNSVAATQRAIEHGDTTYGVCVCEPWSTKTETPPNCFSM